DNGVRPYISVDPLIRYAEKLSPGSVTALKAVNPPQAGQEQGENAEYNKLMQSDITPDQMISGASKLSSNYRSQIYNRASNKLLEQGNSVAARAVLEENFTDDAREQALANFDQQAAWKLINEGKFSDAEALINGLPAASRVNPLVQLANRVYSTNPKENKPYALTILDNARAVIGDHPDDNQEMSQLMEIVQSLTQMDPPRAFDVLERLVAQVNELSDAAVVLWAFQDRNAVRDGEFVITNGNVGGQFGFNATLLAQLSESDLDRAEKLVDSLSRPEVRVAARLQMLSTGLIRNQHITQLPISGRRFQMLID
ncbi:MAG: hypothetical protein JO314_01750, partial [Acidobacteria bacterium]|nr:hypothetical protein [Acidobacteriota bacterium]